MASDEGVKKVKGHIEDTHMTPLWNYVELWRKNWRDLHHNNQYTHGMIHALDWTQQLMTVECERNKGDQSTSAGVGFDPEALERGAKALREINKSPHAKKVLDITKEQENTRQKEEDRKAAEAAALQQQYSVEQEKARWEGQKSYLDKEAQIQAAKAKYDDELARKRIDFQNEKQRQQNAEMVAMKEESSRKVQVEKLKIEEQIQAERRATEKYRSELEKEQIKLRALAEAEGRIKERRTNEDVNRREQILKLKEQRTQAVEVAKAWATSLGNGFRELLTDKTKLTALVGGVSLAALGIYGSREGTRVAAKALDRYLGTPSLVRETSRWSLFGKGRKAGGSSGMFTSGQEEVYEMKNVVLNSSLKERVQSLAGSLLMTKQRGAPFRHMLFYGPPGTGKTMTAKILAKQSQMDFAILTGGDIAPLGGEAVTQLHSLFDWSTRSRKGLVLFIDEADAFLGDRGGKVVQSEGLRAALNALLYRTGDQNYHFSMILATNRPSDLDSAVMNRIDDAIEFPTPSVAEREQLLNLYCQKYLLENKNTKEGTMKIDITPEKLAKLFKKVAKSTESFSGRDIAKMMSAVQAATFGSIEGKLTETLMMEVIDFKIQEFERRKHLDEIALAE